MAKSDKLDEKRIDETTSTEFVGHEWDGIEELDTPMPRWWVITFYLTIIWGVVYVVLYPAWPLIDSATKGTLGWTSRGEFNAEMQALEQQRAPVVAALADVSVADLPKDERLMQAAIEGGRAAFKVHCVQCHGSGAAGSTGYPNLNDDEWLWGGDMEAIHYTLTHGIRNPDHSETRFSQMPAFGEILDARDIDALTGYVRGLSGKGKGSAKGAQIYAQNCAICHGPTGKGDQIQGAPDLTDVIWLYGSDTAAVRSSIVNSRQGVMPRWDDKLDPATITMLTAYVWSLGGGEEAKPKEVTALAEGADEAVGGEEGQNVGGQ